MANPEHVEIVQKGREAIRQWRKDHPTEIFDLSEVAFAGADLWGAELSGASLRGAVLLFGNLGSVYLMNADLSSAFLDQCEFGAANLAGADLSGAFVNSTRFAHVVRYPGGTTTGTPNCFDGTNFEGATIHGVTFEDVNLSQARGLESVIHTGPSDISLGTIVRSNGRIPESFLRGAGVPNALIESIRSLRTDALAFHSVFISYSSKDHDFAERLHADLQTNAVRCWFAPEDLKIGDRIRPTLDETIRVHDKLLLILSEHSLKSQWVEQEVETALRKEREQDRTVLFPIRLDDAVMEIQSGWPALLRNTRHIGDFTKWKDHDSYQKSFARLLRDLRAESGT